MIVLFVILILITGSFPQLQYTFPLLPNQNSFRTSYDNNNVYASRFAYNPQSNTGGPRSYSFHPTARIQVEDPVKESNRNQQQMHQFSPHQYQVDQRIPQREDPPTRSEPSGPMRIIPSFLKTASESDQDKFYEIVQHPTWSGMEKNQKIEEFMKTMSDDRQTEYHSFRRDVHNELEQRRRQVDEAVQTMSKDAIYQFQNVVSIMKDPSLAENEKLKKIEEVYRKLSDSVRNELDSKLKGI